MTDLNAPPSEAAHLTINHDATTDLDSTNAFEGPEKLLEVWFAPSPSALPASAHPHGLKAVPACTWVTMLDMVNCKVLSVLESDAVDAYLLSESSMFVFPHKLILKTCGTTTLLLGLHRLLHIAAADAGFPFHNTKSLADPRAAASPYRVFYSRKNFLFPDQQQGPHRSWTQEVDFLDDMFEGGSAYMVGRMNGDHWYLYMTNPTQSYTRPKTPPGSPSTAAAAAAAKIPTGLIPDSSSSSSSTSLPPQQQQQQQQQQQHDETLEILMMDLDPVHAQQFYHSAGTVPEGASEGHVHGTATSASCGLADVYPTSVYPDARIDSYLFTPCGYSANGLVPSPNGGAGQYWTVHVTPEPHCSFASFETNVPSDPSVPGARSTRAIIDHIVNVFRPGRFSVTLFQAKKASGASSSSAAVEARARLDEAALHSGGYRRIDGIAHDFDDYDLVFRFYERHGWAAQQGTRVGEAFAGGES